MNNDSFNVADYLLGDSGLKVTIGVDKESTLYLTIGIFVALVLALLVFGFLFRR